MSIGLFKEITESYKENQESVRRLMNFDRILLGFCIHHVQELEDRLQNNDEIKITAARFLPTHTLTMLRSIRENDSMRKDYKEIFNQCLVLSVSHFSSAIHSLFIEAINHSCCCCPDLLKVSSEEIKFSFDELKAYNFDLTEGMGELVVRKKDISFQDMQSINRAFNNFFGIKDQHDVHVDNIILAQASRHCIVHVLGIADEKFSKQVAFASQRTIKRDFNLQEYIEFTPDEIESIQNSMWMYIQRVIESIETQIGAFHPTSLPQTGTIQQNQEYYDGIIEQPPGVNY